MPKVLFVLGGALDIGGAENQLVMLSRALAGRGFEVAVLCLWRRGSQADALQHDGIAVHALPRFLGHMRGPLAKVSRLVGGLVTVTVWLRRLRPDVIHFVLPHAYLVGGLACLPFARPRRVMSRRGLNRYLDGRPLTRWIESLLHRRMHVLLGNSRRVGEQLLAEGAPAGRVGLIYNGFDAGRFANLPDRARARERLGLPAQALILVKVANLWGYKGHDDLLEALAGAELGDDWRLLLVGRDEGAGQLLRRRVAELGLAEQVRFLGQSEEVPLLLAAADIGISASHEEGFSNAVLEYLAAGLATVVTDVGGNAEAVGDAGLVVPPAAPLALRAALDSLGDADRRRALAQRARRRAKSFSLQRCVDAHEILYRRLLGEDMLARELQLTAAPEATTPEAARTMD